MENTIKNKALHRSATAILDALHTRKRNWELVNLQYQAQDEDTKRHLYAAIDSLKKFVDNIS